MKLHLDRNNSSINQANKIICLENDFFIRESEKSKYCLKNIFIIEFFNLVEMVHQFLRVIYYFIYTNKFN